MDNSPKRWQIFCINNNTYCISFDRLQRSLSHSFEIFTPMWKTNLKHRKSLAFPVFQTYLFPLFLVGMICNAQQEVRVRTPEWNSNGWFSLCLLLSSMPQLFRTSSSKEGRTNIFLLQEPAWPVGASPLSVLGLWLIAEQLGFHMSRDNNTELQTSFPFSCSFFLSEYIDIHIYLCMLTRFFPHTQRCIYMFHVCICLIKQFELPLLCDYFESNWERV